MPPGRAGLIANIAAVLAGKIPVNLNYTAGKEAVQSAIKQAGIDRFVTADVVVRKMQTFPWPALKDTIFIERILPHMKGTCARWLLLLKILPASMISSLLRIPVKGGDREAALLFTSGSSGDPKGVVLTHRNLISNVSQFGQRLSLKGGSKVLGCLPLFHSFGSTVTVWFPVIQGAGLVTYPTPLEPPKLAELIEKHSVDILLATPTFLRGYMRRVKVEQLASLKLIVTGAEKLPLNFEGEFRARFGKPVMEGYGLTETAAPSHQNPLDHPKQQCLGIPFVSTDARVVDPETLQEVPTGEQGEIVIHGPQVFQGYWKRPDATAAAFFELEGKRFFRSGDLGRVDEDGYFFITDRLKRMINASGYKVWPSEVELLLFKCPLVQEACVISARDAYRGETVKAVVVLRSEHRHTAQPEDIIAWAREHMAAYKVPKLVEFADALPKSGSGKVMWRLLQEQEAAA